MRRDVEFQVEDGTILRGYFHSSRDSAAPVIVMSQGFSGVKEQIDHYAAYFADGGFSVLVHDRRGFGASDGAPRLELDASRQIADWRVAGNSGRELLVPGATVYVRLPTIEWRCESSIPLPSGSRTIEIRAVVPRVIGANASTPPAARIRAWTSSTLKTWNVL